MLDKRMKKLLKKTFTRKQKQIEIKGLIHEACIQYDKDDSSEWTFYAIFDREKVNFREFYNSITRMINLHGDRSYSPYDCSGKLISRRAKVKIYKNRIIVIQSQGFDV